MKKIFVTAVAGFFICAALSAQASAQTAESSKSTEQLWRELEAGNFESDEALRRIVNALASQGSGTIEFLAKKLPAVENDDQRIDITYVTGLTLMEDRRRQTGALTLPPDMMKSLAALLESTDNQDIQANIVNIASNLGPRATPFIDGLLGVLRKTSHRGLRASTQYALMASGDQAVPVLYDELRRSTDERMIGDIAVVLRDRELPADIIDIFRKQLDASASADVRAQLMQALQGAGAEGQELVSAAVKNLENSNTDMSRMMAALDLDKLSPPRDIYIFALSDALGKFTGEGTSSERMQVARMLGIAGDDGVRALAKAVRATKTAGQKQDLVMALSMYAINDPEVIDVLITTAITADNEDVTGNAMSGVIRIGKPALPAIEAALQNGPPPGIRIHLETARSMIRSR